VFLRHSKIALCDYTGGLGLFGVLAAAIYYFHFFPVAPRPQEPGINGESLIVTPL